MCVCVGVCICVWAFPTLLTVGELLFRRSQSRKQLVSVGVFFLFLFFYKNSPLHSKLHLVHHMITCGCASVCVCVCLSTCSIANPTYLTKQKRNGRRLVSQHLVFFFISWSHLLSLFAHPLVKGNNQIKAPGIVFFDIIGQKSITASLTL